jgi:hypothetical protein
MALFEGLRRPAAANGDGASERLEESLSRAGQAEADVSAAQDRSAYAQARLTEVLPDLQLIALLEIEARSAGARLERAREMRLLAQQLLARGRLRSNGPELESAIRGDTAAADELAAREREHLAAVQVLEAVRTRAEAREAELRLQFGLD